MGDRLQGEQTGRYLGEGSINHGRPENKDPDGSECAILHKLGTLVDLANTNLCRARTACESLAQAQPTAREAAELALLGALAVQRMAKAMLGSATRQQKQWCGQDAATAGQSSQQQQAEAAGEASPRGTKHASEEGTPQDASKHIPPEGGKRANYFGSPAVRPVDSGKLRKVYFAMAESVRCG